MAYSKVQKEIILYDQNEMLVKGVAGSGKTLCLLQNSIKKARESDSIYFFTFNKTLKNYIDSVLIRKKVDNIKVTTFHAWAMGEMKKIYSGFHLLNDKKEAKYFLKQAIQSASREYDGRFVKDITYEAFLFEEFEYINSQYIEDFNIYIDYPRIGRGNAVRLSREDRKEIFAIYENYQAQKYNRQLFEFHDFARYLLDNIDKVDKGSSMRHVYIDEGQDLDKAQLLLLRNLAKESFYIAADKGQKIYQTSYSWKDIGLNILGGRTKTLTKSFRTTAPILNLANCLQLNDSIKKDDDFLVADLNDMRNGPLPEIFIYEDSKSDKYIVELLKSRYTSGVDKVVGLIVNTWYEATRIEKSLKKNKINHERVKEDHGDTLSPGVKITTMHSSKGLEFDHVIFVNFKLEKNISDNQDALDIQRRLYYVSFTRARNMLSIFVPKNEPSLLFDELDVNLYTKI